MDLCQEEIHSKVQVLPISPQSSSSLLFDDFHNRKKTDGRKTGKEELSPTDEGGTTAANSIYY